MEYCSHRGAVGGRDALIRQQGTGRFRVGHRWSLGAQRVTALDCFNTVLSPILLAAASDRSIAVRQPIAS
jgi:hypothetical protein